MIQLLLAPVAGIPVEDGGLGGVVSLREGREDSPAFSEVWETHAVLADSTPEDAEQLQHGESDAAEVTQSPEGEEPVEEVLRKMDEVPDSGLPRSGGLVTDLPQGAATFSEGDLLKGPVSVPEFVRPRPAVHHVARAPLIRPEMSGSNLPDVPQRMIRPDETFQKLQTAGVTPEPDGQFAAVPEGPIASDRPADAAVETRVNRVTGGESEGLRRPPYQAPVRVGAPMERGFVAFPIPQTTTESPVSFEGVDMPVNVPVGRSPAALRPPEALVPMAVQPSLPLKSGSDFPDKPETKVVASTAFQAPPKVRQAGHAAMDDMTKTKAVSARPSSLNVEAMPPEEKIQNHPSGDMALPKKVSFAKLGKSSERQVQGASNPRSPFESPSEPRIVKAELPVRKDATPHIESNVPHTSGPSLDVSRTVPLEERTEIAVTSVRVGPGLDHGRQPASPAVQTPAMPLDVSRPVSGMTVSEGRGFDEVPRMAPAVEWGVPTEGPTKVRTDFSATRLASVPGHGELPTARATVQQLVEAVQTRGSNVVELALRPEELGKVRMVLASGDTQMSVVIQAERQGTEDLLRRHLDHLQNDLKELGYTSISFAFGDRSTEEGREGDAIEVQQTPDGDGEEINLTVSGNPRLRGGNGIDIRM